MARPPPASVRPVPQHRSAGLAGSSRLFLHARPPRAPGTATHTFAARTGGSTQTAGAFAGNIRVAICSSRILTRIHCPAQRVLSFTRSCCGPAGGSDSETNWKKSKVKIPRPFSQTRSQTPRARSEREKERPEKKTKSKILKEKPIAYIPPSRQDGSPADLLRAQTRRFSQSLFEARRALSPRAWRVAEMRGAGPAKVFPDAGGGCFLARPSSA